MKLKGILPMYKTCRGFCGIAAGDSILLSSSCKMHYCHIAPVETYTSTLIKLSTIRMLAVCGREALRCTSYALRAAPIPRGAHIDLALESGQEEEEAVYA
jgi:hypothetical protein